MAMFSHMLSIEQNGVRKEVDENARETSEAAQVGHMLDLRRWNFAQALEGEGENRGGGNKW
jgi:hypothetical protein